MCVKIEKNYFPLIDEGRFKLLKAIIAYSDKTYSHMHIDRWLSDYVELYKNDDYFVRGILAEYLRHRALDPVREKSVLDDILRLNPNDYVSYYQLANLYNYSKVAMNCIENALIILRTRFLLNNYELQDITYYILCMDFYNEIQHGHVTSFTGYQVDELMHRLDRNEFFYKLPDFLWCDCNKSHEYVKKFQNHATEALNSYSELLNKKYRYR